MSLVRLSLTRCIARRALTLGPRSTARLGRLPLTSLGMTSNGIALKRKLPALVAAGLTHLNLSLDTLDPLKYDLMTRRRGFSAVMEALEVARSLPGLKTKINMVVIRGERGKWLSSQRGADP